MHKTLLTPIALLALALAPAAWAAGEHGQQQAQASSPAQAESLTAGVVRKVDKAAGKLTIRHEEIKNLGMPPMTMVFRVKDPAWLEQLKPEDRIRFVADKVNGAFTVMRYERAE
jgi:Cu/Ag efflux protein CusF